MSDPIVATADETAKKEVKVKYCATMPESFSVKVRLNEFALLSHAGTREETFSLGLFEVRAGSPSAGQAKLGN